jgi:cytochrome c biogenesis protein CcmG/thiol:disulfide interchange protein DsbE
MTHGRRTVLLVCFLAAVCGDALSAGKEPPIGKTAPDFHVTTFDGTKLSLADFKGQVLVVNFWATWCTPCKAELPMLDAYYKAQQQAGLKVLAVTTEDSLPPSQLKKLASVLTIPMVRQFRGDYGPIKAVPTNFVIDRAGVLRYAKAGAWTLDDLNDILVPLLREEAPAI